MSNEVDFLDLYRQLRVSPDCGLEEFKQAYRRRVSTLHPDRKPAEYPGYTDSRAAQRLQQLNVQFNAAMEFQRLYGRLPGAPRGPAFSPPRFHASPTPSSPASSSSGTPRRPSVKWLIPIALVAIGILFWGASAVTPLADNTTDSTTRDNDPGLGDTPAAPTLALGMSPDNVRAIEGNPVAIRDDLWEYGPSWVRFDHGSVIDWYSSPLHSLKTSEIRPSAARN